jgi:hypothetical protein
MYKRLNEIQHVLGIGFVQLEMLTDCVVNIPLSSVQAKKKPRSSIKQKEVD